MLGVPEEKPFFIFNEQEIAAFHDPPHLLKCAHNLFKNYHVKNVCRVIGENGEMGVGTAKWDDRIVKLYEHDKRCVYCLLP